MIVEVNSADHEYCSIVKGDYYDKQRASSTCLSVHPIHVGPRVAALRGTKRLYQLQSLFILMFYHGFIVSGRDRHLCRSFALIRCYGVVNDHTAVTSLLRTTRDDIFYVARYLFTMFYSLCVIYITFSGLRT